MWLSCHSCVMSGTRGGIHALRRGCADPSLVVRYLLGSGGTLIFDLTIMCQAMYYGSAKPVEPPISHHDAHTHTHAHHHHRSRSRSTFRTASGTHGTRNASESRSFTSLDAVDEESQLLSNNDQRALEIPGSAMMDSTGELTPRSSVASRREQLN